MRTTLIREDAGRSATIPEVGEESPRAASAWTAIWRPWGQLAGFSWAVIRRLLTWRVGSYFGEALRQAGILITGSVMVIFALVFILGLQCGIEGAYSSAAIGSPTIAGAFSAICDLREVIPYAFAYMMAAKVATGYAAELGAMRIADEIDAIDVMGLDSVTFLCATRLLAVWLVLPFLFIAALAVGYTGSYLAVVREVNAVSSAGYLAVFWQFQSPPDLIFAGAKAMAMATYVVLVGCYYGYRASGGPVGVGRAAARTMAVSIIGIQVIGILGTQLFWGANPRSPVGG